METKDKNSQILYHIIDYCERIMDTVAPCEQHYDRFIANYQTRDICCFYITQIGELITKLADEWKLQHQSIPWREIKAMRNIVVHRYGTVDTETVWDVAITDIPKLNMKCREILASSENDYLTKLSVVISVSRGTNNNQQNCMSLIESDLDFEDEDEYQR